MLHALIQLWKRRLKVGVTAGVVAVTIMFLSTGVYQKWPDDMDPSQPPQRRPVVERRTDPLEPIEVIPLESLDAFFPAVGYNVYAFVDNYFAYWAHTLTGRFTVEVRYMPNLGISGAQPPPTAVREFGTQIWEGAGKSLKVVLTAITAGTLFGVLVGAGAIFSRLFRKAAISFAVAGLSIPDFCLVMLGQLTAIWSYSNFGFRPWSVGVPNAPDQLVLPIVALSIPIAAYIARLTITGMDEVMHEDYIRTARSKGVSEVRVLLGHALRNALPRITNGLPSIMNVTLSSLLVAELLTSMTGLGRMLMTATVQERATAVLIFCLWYTVLDALAHTIRIISNPLLREVSQ